MEYKCYRCGYSSMYKKDIKKHLNRKKICNPEIMNISTKECLEMMENEDKEMVRILMNMLKQKNDEIKTLTSKMTTTSISGITGNVLNGDHNDVNNSYNTTNNNIHIHINSYDKTDYTVLKDKLHTCIKDGKVDEAKLIELLHFNKDAPQNHNVKITNKRENRIRLYDGNEFKDSEYTGKEGIWEFSQDTLKKTKDHDIAEDVFVEFNNTLCDNDNIQRKEKSKKVAKASKVIYSK